MEAADDRGGMMRTDGAGARDVARGDRPIVAAPARAADLRARCPGFAAFIDDLRRAFGRAEIDGQLRRGLAGEPTFHVVVEDAHGRLELGTPKPSPRMVLDGAAYLEWGRKIAEIEDAVR